MQVRILPIIHKIDTTMKRIVKFRGKSKRTGEWLYGDLVRNVEGAFAIVPPFEMTTDNLCDQYEVDEETIGQLVVRYKHIGEEPLEIYTDDVLDIWDTEDDEVPHCLSIVDEHGLVSWQQSCGWLIENLDKCGFDFKVVGNIYDNSDLKEKAV